MELRFFYTITMLPLCLFGCTKNSDSELWKQVDSNTYRIVALEKKADAINEDISTLQVLVESASAYSSVSSCAELSNIPGYALSFKSGRTIVVKCRSYIDKNTPAFCVRRDNDDIFYWTFNGEWLYNSSGSKVEVLDSVLPQVRVRNAQWNISFDAGLSWGIIGEACEENDNILKACINSIKFENEYIVISLFDESVIRFRVMQDNVVSNNRYNSNTALVGYFIQSGNKGILLPATHDVDRFGVSDFIPVYGTDMITNARIGNPLVASIAVYDNNKNLLRVISNNRQYFFHEGDSYIRVSFDEYLKGQVNFGHTLVEYDEYHESSGEDSQSEKGSSNIYNYKTSLVGYYIGKGDGTFFEPSYNKDKFGISDFIEVKGNDISSNASANSGAASFNVYDINKRLIRTQINDPQYIFREGDVYIRFCFDDYRYGHANYGRELKSFEEYWPTDIDALNRVYDKYAVPAISWIDDDFCYSQANAPVYDAVHNWCINHSIYYDVAFIPYPNETISTSRVTEIKKWQDDGFGILMHPVHDGWYDVSDKSNHHDATVIRQSMVRCIRLFDEYGINTYPIVVYPGSSGEYAATRRIVRDYVECGICWNNFGDSNHKTENERYYLKRLNIQLSSSNTKSQIKEYIRKAVMRGDWIIMGSHIYRFQVSDVKDETSMTTANLYEILEYADSLCGIRLSGAIWRDRKYMFDFICK